MWQIPNLVSPLQLPHSALDSRCLLEKRSTWRAALVALFWQTSKVEAGGQPSVSGGCRWRRRRRLQLTPLTQRPQFYIDFTQSGEDKPMWRCICEKAGGLDWIGLVDWITSPWMEEKADTLLNLWCSQDTLVVLFIFVIFGWWSSNPKRKS